MNYREFYDLVGKFYPEDEIVYQRPNHRIREKIIKKYLKEQKGHIIDIGCSSGRYLSHGVMGADISIEKLRKSKSRLLVNLDVEEDLCFSENTFDFVLFSEILEHLRNPAQALKNIFYVLKPRGKILITTPHKLSKSILYEKIGPLIEYGIAEGTHGNKYIHRNFSKEELKKLLDNAGFETIELYSIENELRGWGKLILPFQRMPRFYKIIEIPYLNFICDFLDQSGLIRLQKKIFKEGMRLLAFARKP
jgi:2-polyprenyl-3-methyl-5-hydroxy-6-metoxy-1,4-benzoquinol methylase